ncbi:putative Nucleotide-diphospho-sugar transferase [Seiridium cardinale]
MIPERNYLRAIVAHILQDPKFGAIYPSQSFYNFLMNDLLYQSQLNPWRSTEIIRHLADISWNTGSGFILGRQALIDIGGFPTHSLTEDVLSSMMVMAKGWKTAYLAESLQYGLMPDSYLAHIKQLTRWNPGGIQMANHFQWYLFKGYTGLFTIWQRLLGLPYAILAATSPFLTATEPVATPLCLVGGVSLVYFSNTQGLVCSSAYAVHQSSRGGFMITT